MIYNHLSLLHIFNLVATHSSFIATAKELNLPRSSISKKIKQLEDIIGQPLFQRSTRELHLTDVGRQLFTITEPISNTLINIHRLIDDMQITPSGKVKISASQLIGQNYIIPLLNEIRQRFPFIKLEMNFTDEIIDLLSEDVDIAVRTGHLPDSSYMARKIGEKKLSCFASPKYLKSNKPILFPEDLKQHQCLLFINNQHTSNHWSLIDSNGITKIIEINPVIITDNSRSLVDMACNALGLILVDPLTIKNELRDNHLVAVLSEWKGSEINPINLVCLGKRQQTNATKAIWYFLSDRLQYLLNDNIC